VIRSRLPAGRLPARRRFWRAAADRRPVARPP